jgi:hypothetical protein
MTYYIQAIKAKDKNFLLYPSGVSTLYLRFSSNTYIKIMKLLICYGNEYISHAENVYIRGTFYRNKNNYVQLLIYKY